MASTTKKNLFENSILNVDIDEYVKNNPDRKVYNRRYHHKFLFTKTQIKEEIKKGNYSLNDFEIFGYMQQHYLGYEFLLYVKKDQPDKDLLFQNLCLPMAKLKKLQLNKD